MIFFRFNVTTNRTQVLFDIHTSITLDPVEIEEYSLVIATEVKAGAKLAVGGKQIPILTDSPYIYVSSTTGVQKGNNTIKLTLTYQLKL